MNKEKLTELIYINLGRASMCWSDIPSGVFYSTKAAELGKEIMEAIEKYVEEGKELRWSDPMVDHLDREEKESEWQRRRRLEVMKEARMNPNPAHYESREITVEDIHKIHRDMIEKERTYSVVIDEVKLNGNFTGMDGNNNLTFRYKGVYYTLDNSFKKILEEAAAVSNTPASSWMEEYYDDYIKLQASGMFWEFHPTWTGIWDNDKYAFCHDRKYKK